MVLTDPPYGIDLLDENWDSNKIENRKNSKVIKNLPGGMKFDREQSYKFEKFYKKVSEEVYRILKPGGGFISFSSQRLYHRMCIAVEDSGFEIRDMLAWIYTKSQTKSFSFDHFIDKDKNIKNKEEIKNKLKGWKSLQLKPCIEPICFANKPVEGRFIDNFLKYNVGLLNTNVKVGDNKFPSNVITTEEINNDYDTVFLIEKPNKKEKGEYNNHPSVKPISLLEHLIKLFTKENATILDPFMGSGSTMIACLRTNRNGIGIEKDVSYFEISKNRIDNFNKNNKF